MAIHLPVPFERIASLAILADHVPIHTAWTWIARYGLWALGFVIVFGVLADEGRFMYVVLAFLGVAVVALVLSFASWLVTGDSSPEWVYGPLESAAGALGDLLAWLAPWTDTGLQW